MATRTETTVVYAAAFGVAPLQKGGVELSAIYAWAAVAAALMGVWSFVIARRRPSLVSLHPDPGRAG